MDEAAKKLRLHSGLQDKFFYNAVTFGNSSTAVTGPYRRSQPRLAYTRPRGPAILYAQYRTNHLYVYPEHRDHDPGHNRQDGGYGDVYCANTPYVIVSQGSSGSDRPFLDAIACTLAAFRPQVKQFLARRGALMPTIQMIFRWCNQRVGSAENYLTGRAHPTVFEGKNLDVLKMVILAHDIRREEVPPLIHLRVVEEDRAVVGKDYFDIGGRERPFDTPAAIARVFRTTKYFRRMRVSAEQSVDLNNRKLTWHWTVLRGNADAIKIKPLNESASVVELLIPYHKRRPICAGATISSNRVDIGAFVHNGKYYSAPGFVTFFFLDNEKRFYNDDKQIEWVQYTDPRSGGNYVDPLVDVPKNWRDEYQYDDRKRLIGWTRSRGNLIERFSADGALVIRRDKQKRPVQARTLRYVATREGNKPPLLVQQLGDEILHYEYVSPEDRIGRVSQRTKAQ